jgi:RNA polymerase sigma-70 factor (ECF subfamily)
LPGPGDPAAPADEPEELERWRAFHEAVERLPTEEREVVSLIFYHGCTRVQVAELLQVDERTVRRRWRAAMLTLHDLLAETPDEVGEDG